MSDNIRRLEVKAKRGRQRASSMQPLAQVHQLNARRLPMKSGHIELPPSREEVQAMFDELAHHLLMTVRVITSRLR